MKLKVHKPQKGGGTVNVAADNAETRCSAAPEQGRTEPDGTQPDDNSAGTRMDANDNDMSGGGTNAAHREGGRHEKFTWNIKYLTICLYAVLVVLASVLIIKAVIDWDNVMHHIKGAMNVLSPFLWGAFIAFLINPLVKLFDNKIFGKIKPLKKHEKPRKMLSLLISYLLVIFVVVIMFVYLLPQIGTSLTEIVNQVPGWIAELNNGLLKFEEEHPDFDYDKEVKAAKKVAKAMKKDGWEFASHTWGHRNATSSTAAELKTDNKKWEKYVAPILGKTDMIIFAFGADIGDWEGYTSDNEKYEYYKSRGYRYFCNVDSSQYFVQITSEYFRQGRRNLDGYRMYYNPDMLSDLFDVSEVWDSSRPTPVPEM